MERVCVNGRVVRGFVSEFGSFGGFIHKSKECY
jgi:hypothetical protein